MENAVDTTTIEEKRKRTKMQIARQVVAIIAVVIFGVFSGFYFGNLYLSSQIKRVDYSKFSEDDLMDDVAPIIAKAEGKDPTQLSATEVFVLANYNLNNSQMFVLNAEGELNHLDKQTVYNYRYLYNGIQYNEEISRGSMKSVAEKMIVSAKAVKVYAGAATGRTTASWSTNFKEFTFETYKAKIGISPVEIIPYIVSSKTVDSASEVKMVGVNRFQFTLDLNLEKSVIRYVKKIKYLSDLSEFPTFLHFKATVVVDADFNFISILTNEKYTFSYMGIRVTCEGFLNQIYDFENPPKELKI